MIERVRESLQSQLNLFYLALSFFTRLPVPKTMHYSDLLLNKANRYFSLVGILIGGILGVFYSGFSPFVPANIAILLIMVLSLLLTGAFHEDGLADMADGMGGGFTKEKKLSIMKDSRIGTYGAVTLVMAFLLKYALLVELSTLNSNHLLIAIVLAESLSRAVAGSLISTMPYVSDSDLSKSKPLAQAQSLSELALLLLVGLMPLIFYPSQVILSLLLVLIAFRYFFKHWLMAKIGGFTGDCLGAAQQISQLLIYITLVASLNKVTVSGVLG
ncbi:MAG: adenosylcobinamide-GDP ribazoletransferase [Colwellia sp.]